MASREAMAILALASSRDAGRRLSQSKIAAALCRAGRQRGIEASAERIQAALRAPQLDAHPGVVGAYAAAVRSLVAVIDAPVTPVEVLSEEVEAGVGRHPDAEIYLSQPGLGPDLGARVLAEFGDDPTRYADAKGRKNYSGMARITRASGTRRMGWPAPPETAAWPAPSTGRPSPRSAARRERGPTTTPSAPAAPPITRPCVPYPTDSSASCTAACATTPATTKPSPGTPTPPLKGTAT
jgi:hypothetical protein